jgi:hypothetical protein
VASPQSKTRTQPDLKGRAHGVASHLFLVLVSDRPSDPSLRISLQGLDEVVVKRESSEEVRPAAAAIEGRRLTLAVSDAWMSGTHAVLRKVYACWVLEDAGSKNGSFVGGVRVQRHALADGDLIELGHTLLLFRESVPLLPGSPTVFRSDEASPAAPGLATLSPALEAEFTRMRRVARSRLSVVIVGETGTGKELVASAIHALSHRTGPFLAVNCATFAPSLVQSELFGYTKGAFPGAGEDKAGIIQSAQGGTLFLDQIGDLAPASQPLLLRVLESGELFPIGAVRPVSVDVRVVAATDRDLRSFAPERFRVDLLARLSEKMVLPPLRERREDLGLLIRELIRRQTGSDAAGVSLTIEAARALLLHSWPLNVRELEKALQAALMLASGGPVGLQHLPSAIAQPSSPPPPAPAPAAPVPKPPPAAAPPSGFQHFIDELWRRRVVRVVVGYTIFFFGALQGLDIIASRLELPQAWMRWVVIGCLAGLPLSAGLAWVFDLTGKGIVRTPSLAPGQVAAQAGRGSRKLMLLAAVLGVVVLIAASAALWRGQHGAPKAPSATRSSP